MLPARPENDLAVRHGAHSLRLTEQRAAELANGLRAIVPAGTSADEPTVQLLALVLARIERANDWLAEHGIFRNGKGEPQPILKTLSTWENTAARLLRDLGCTPTSRAALGLDLARTGDTLAALREEYRR